LAFLDNLGVGKVDFRNNPTLAKKFIKHELQRCVLQQVFGSDLNGFSVLDRELIEELEYPTFRYFMLTNGMVFEGEDVPVIDDEVSLSILDELSDDPSLLDEDDEALVVSTKEIKLPSPHIMLMDGADLTTLDYTDKNTMPSPITNIKPIKGEGDAE